jgi:hypothetical protein
VFQFLQNSTRQLVKLWGELNSLRAFATFIRPDYDTPSEDELQQQERGAVERSYEAAEETKSLSAQLFDALEKSAPDIGYGKYHHILGLARRLKNSSQEL